MRGRWALERHAIDLCFAVVNRDFDEIRVGVPEIDRSDRSGRAGAGDGAFFDGDACRLKMDDHFVDGRIGNQA